MNIFMSAKYWKLTFLFHMWLNLKFSLPFTIFIIILYKFITITSKQQFCGFFRISIHFIIDYIKFTYYKWIFISTKWLEAISFCKL